MDEADILGKLSQLAADHFDIPGLELSRESVAGDVAGWDSLAHIQFVIEVERSFGIRFKSSEISGFQNVGQLASRIQALLAA